MIKRISAVLVLVMAFSLAMTGCDKNKGAETYVKEYFESIIDGGMTPEKSYDEYISQQSKDLLGITKEQYAEDWKKSMDGIKYKSVSISNVVSYDDTIYKVRCKLEVEKNGASATFTNDEYVINENGAYKFLQYGVNAKEELETTYTTGQFSMASDKLFTGPDRVMINLIAKNNTTNSYSVGFGGDARITVVTDQGSFDEVLEGTNVVRPMEEAQGYQWVDDIKGDIKTITIYNIYELDASNRQKDANNARSYVLYKAEGAEE